MSTSEAELVKNGKLTTFYMRLLDNVNKKLNSKLETASKSLITDFEKKKADLIKSKKILEDLHKIHISIQDINKYYKYPGSKIIKDVKSIRLENIPSTPNITTRNILDTLENIEVKIENGEYIQMVQKSTGATGANPSLLVQDSDNFINTFTRLSIKKKSELIKLDNKKMGIETATMGIILRFKGYRVNPEMINIRYLTLPNEPKQLFSYINTVLGSNDGIKWEPIGNVNLGMMRNFEKATLFKYPVSVKTPQFYEYLCLQSQGTKEAMTKDYFNKLSSRITVPICNFELFGNYYSTSVTVDNNKIEEDLQIFFDEYINTSYSSTSNKTELEYLLKMTLEAFKELNDVITEYKLQNAKNSNENIVSVSDNIVKLEEEMEIINEEQYQANENEQPQEYETVETNTVETEVKENDDIDADLLALMNNTKKASKAKQIKTLDTETNSVISTNKQRKKKVNK